MNVTFVGRNRDASSRFYIGTVDVKVQQNFDVNVQILPDAYQSDVQLVGVKK